MDYVQSHYEVVRDILQRFDGREIKTAGDSMLIVFAAPSEAVKFSLFAMKAMRQARMSDPRFPSMRVGIHQGQVVLDKSQSEGREFVDVYGLQVSTAARIMDLAQANQTLLSRSVFDDARAILRADEFKEFNRITWCNHGHYRFKGIDDHHEICEVGEEAQAPLSPPPASAKGWPIDRAVEELGWRPALGVAVPETNWQLIEKVGQGEFGEVWKAYNLSDKSFQVFKFCFKRSQLPSLKREARLLKRLKKYAHPNLVEVYDVTEGDRPPHYLEMEFVDGPKFLEWLAGQPPLQERLDVIAQVADALDVVHAAGIYHRDIKPANILLTRREDGKLLAKLSDFGLGAAQDIDLLRSIETSKVGSISGTWDYLAPELRHGSQPSPQSDIYSLGITLYQAIVGDTNQPLTGDWEQHLPDDILRNDVRQCVSQSRENRWKRAADLAQALRSHEQRLQQLELEKLHAIQRQRVRRLRNIAFIAAAAAALTLIIGGFAMFQWREAVRQRDRAVAQKRLALLAISQLTHDVPKRLRDVPGTIPALREILEENISLIDQILQYEPDTPLARRERGVNLISIGDRWMLIGDTQNALDRFQSALAISRELVQLQPDRTEFHRDVSVGLDRIGDAYQAIGRTGDALQAYRESLAITTRLLEANPSSSEARRDLWQALDKMGMIYLKTDQTDQAEQCYEQALDIVEQLVKDEPSEVSHQSDLALCLERIGDLRLMNGQLETALAMYSQALERGKQVVQALPNRIDVLRGLSISYDKLGNALLRLDRFDEAAAAYSKSLELAESLLSRDPESVQLQRDYSVGIDRLGDIHMMTQNFEQALVSFQRALEIADRLANIDRNNVSNRLDLLTGHVKVGDALLALERLDDSLTNYEKAAQIGSELVQKDPDNGDVERNYSVALGKLGSVQFMLGKINDAAESLEIANRLAEKRAGADPSNLEAQRDFGVSSFKVMLVAQMINDGELWRRSAHHAIRQFRLVYEKSSDQQRVKLDLINCLKAACSGAQEIASPSESDLASAVEWATQLVELSDRANPTYLELLADFLSLRGETDKAKEMLEQALQLLQSNEDQAEAASRVRTKLSELAHVEAADPKN